MTARSIATMVALAAGATLLVFGAGRCSFFASDSRAARSSADLAPGRDVAEENQLPGTTSWQITRPSHSGEIQAYTGQVSVQRGDLLDVYVSTKGAAAFDVDVYRMGWYGGSGARDVLSLSNIDGEDQGRWDPHNGLQNCGSCTIDAATLLVEARWRRSMRIQTHGDWLSGYYIIKFRELATDTETYAPFILRDDASRAPILVQAPTNTWQAYNTWGDASLYGSFGADRKYVKKERRAYRVSYDRPYDPTINEFANEGAGEFFSWEYNFVRWAERSGYDMTYTSNVDVSLRPETLRQHRLFVSTGHDEYWTRNERDGVDAARDAGVNIAFFGGNDVYWQARLEPSSSGTPARVLTVYKDLAKDPRAKSDPGDATVLFADPPVSRPQSLLTGVAYGSNTTNPDYQAWRASDTSSWVLAGTGIERGGSFPGIVGYEYDRMAAPGARPDGLIVLGDSPVDGFIGRDRAATTLYEAKSGANVFAAGTVAWSWGLDNFGHAANGQFADSRLQKMTANILDRLGRVSARTD